MARTTQHGATDIAACRRRRAALARRAAVEQQSRVLQPATDGRRRVVLATNVAESVGDPARRARGDRQRARARAALRSEQRLLAAGRGVDLAGLRRPARRSRRPRRRRLGVSAVAAVAAAGAAAAAGDRPGRTGLAGAGTRGLGQRCLRFVDPPPTGALAAARDLLRRLDALDARHAITARGRRMLALGTHPRLAAMLLVSNEPRASRWPATWPR
jgi:ATP-dependent helicase HrpB